MYILAAPERESSGSTVVKHKLLKVNKTDFSQLYTDSRKDNLHHICLRTDRSDDPTIIYTTNSADDCLEVFKALSLIILDDNGRDDNVRIINMAKRNELMETIVKQADDNESVASVYHIDMRPTADTEDTEKAVEEVVEKAATPSPDKDTEKKRLGSYKFGGHFKYKDRRYMLLDTSHATGLTKQMGQGLVLDLTSSFGITKMLPYDVLVEYCD